MFIGFPGSSVGKESTCNAGDPGSIRGSGSSPREGIGCPLQYSWASLVAQMVKNLPAMQETWFQSLGWKDPLENGRDTHSSILTRRIPWATVHRVAKSWTWLSDFHFHSKLFIGMSRRKLLFYLLFTFWKFIQWIFVMYLVQC